MNESVSYCRQMAERHERNRYILSLAADAAVRPALWAVIAFNHEISKVRDVAHEAVTGHIRLTWWRDALVDGKYSHEILSCLRAAMADYQLPVSLFVDLIDARMRDADNTPPPALDVYAQATNLPLLKLFAAITAAADDAQTLQHLAIAYGLTGLMRSLSYFIRHDDHVLPLEALAGIGIAPEQFSHIKPDEKLLSYVRTIADQANAHLKQADPRARIFRALKKMTGLYLKNLQRARYNPFDERYTRDVPFLAMRVLF